MQTNNGFSLIELLVAIAVLGIIAGGVLVAINPLEKLAQLNDQERKKTLSQLGKAVGEYYNRQSAVYPPTGTSWMTTLKTSGELKNLPLNPVGTGYAIGCNNSGDLAQNGYCYDSNLTDAIIFARAESKSSAKIVECNATTEATWIVWSSSEGKTGLVCLGIGVDPSVNTVYNLK